MVCVPFYVQPHAEEARRQGGAWNARRVVEKVVPLPDCISVFCPKKLHKKTEKILYDTTVIFSYVHNISTEKIGNIKEKELKKLIINRKIY